MTYYGKVLDGLGSKKGPIKAAAKAAWAKVVPTLQPEAAPLEMKALYEDKLFHGEAVAIDMAFSAVVSYVRGHIEEDTLDEIIAMMRGLGLPVYHADFDVEMVAQAMYERVKFSQGQKIPLPTGRGIAHLFNDITEDQLVAALAEWKERYGGA